MDVKEIKQEIKEEESFLLRLFQLEKFVKKYRYHLIALFLFIIAGIIGTEIKSYLYSEMLIRTNQAYNQLLENPNNKVALEKLKENEKLYKLYLLQTSNGDNSKLKIVANGKGVIADIAKYELAVLKGDKNSIENYTLQVGTAIYKNLALLNLERIYLENGNHKKAEEIVKNIDDADIAPFAEQLLHYGIVKK